MQCCGSDLIRVQRVAIVRIRILPRLKLAKFSHFTLKPHKKIYKKLNQNKSSHIKYQFFNSYLIPQNKMDPDRFGTATLYSKVLRSKVTFIEEEHHKAARGVVFS